MKTRNFSNDKYVGDPINAVRIFNEKEADELIVLDIDASTQRREPDYKMIENLAAECRMPLCYGGGIKSIQQAKRIMGLGVEKVALSSAILARPALVSEIAEQVGSQSVVAVLDVKRRAFGSSYHVYIHNGKEDTGMCPIEFAGQLESLGVGEIVINSIDNDGCMSGYDLGLPESIRKAVHVPMTVMGGAGSLKDLEKAIEMFGVVGVAAGSMFVFKGTYRAVLISYPSRSERDALQRKHHAR